MLSRWRDCQEATYLSSCPGSFCPPRSRWTATRSEQHGTSCFRPRGWTPAASPPPCRQPQRCSWTSLRKTWAVDILSSPSVTGFVYLMWQSSWKNPRTSALVINVPEHSERLPRSVGLFQTPSAVPPRWHLRHLLLIGRLDFIYIYLKSNLLLYLL